MRSCLKKDFKIGLTQGLTLIEIVIAMSIFGMIAVAITGLTAKAVDQSQDRSDINHQQVVIANLFDAIRSDLQGAVSACVSTNGSGCVISNGIHTTDGILTPSTGNTLDIITHGTQYWDGSQVVQNSDNLIIRYQTFDNGGHTQIRRTQSSPGATSPVAVSASSARVFNPITGGVPQQNISLEFTGRKGDTVPLYSGGSQSWVISVGIRNGSLTSVGKGNRYDQEFGNHMTIIPDTDFLVRTGVKFL